MKAKCLAQGLRWTTQIGVLRFISCKPSTEGRGTKLNIKSGRNASCFRGSGLSYMFMEIQTFHLHVCSTTVANCMYINRD